MIASSATTARDVSQRLAADGFDHVEVARLVFSEHDPLDPVRYMPTYAAAFGPALLEDGGTPGLLLALLTYGATLTRSRYRRISSRTRAALEQLGWVERTPAGVRATVAVTTIEGLHVVSDRLLELDTAGVKIAREIDSGVMPPSASTVDVWTYLRGLPACTSFLDIGCGSGVHALLLARQGTHAVGVDRDARSVRMSEVNAVVNGLPATFHVRGAGPAVADFPATHASFNTPWAPDYQSPDAVPTYVPLRRLIVEELLPNLQADANVAVYAVLEVTRDVGDPERWLQAIVPSGCGVRVTLEPLLESPFRLSAEDIQARRIPPGSGLLHQAGEQNLLLTHVERQAVEEILPCVVSLGAGATS